MPQDPASVLSALLRSSSIEDHDEVLKAANAAIKANKNDVASQHTRIVALLKLDRFEDALRAISEGGAKIEASCVLEKAYALYKTGKLDEASKLLQDAGGVSKGLHHITAQVAYRAERFDEARQIYERLSQSEIGDESNDVRINLEAIEAQALWKGLQSSRIEDGAVPDTFELCFNRSCVRLAGGEMDDALKLLQRAIALCNASDDLTDSEKQAELRPMLAQQAYIYAKRGQRKDAMDLHQKLEGATDADVDFKIVAQNNLAALNAKTQTNPYITQRGADERLKEAATANLPKLQSNILYRNYLIADFQAQKTERIHERVAKRTALTPQATTDPAVNVLSVVDAAAKAHGKPTQAAIRTLRDGASQRPQDTGFILALIQAQVNQGKPGAALARLKAYQKHLTASQNQESVDLRYSPGVVALAVALMKAQGHHTSAKHELAKAAKHWKSRSANAPSSLLQEAGIELLRSSNLADLTLAGSAFEQLLQQQKGSKIASAGLVASLAPLDSTKVQGHTSELPQVDLLTRGINVETLLDSGIAAAAPFTSGARKHPAPAKDEAAVRAAKRQRKRKLPKNYVEGKVPDPERWLPLRDRSSYRPKGKKGKKKAAEATQGGMVKEEETLELVGGGGVKVEKLGGAGGGGGGGNKKKKKKGKK